MKKHLHNGSGKSNPSTPFGNKEVIFPVTFMFKAVMDATLSDENNKASLVRVFEKSDIVNLFQHQKLSSKGNYISFTYKVTLVSKQQMYNMYNQLKEIQGLKFAL